MCAPYRATRKPTPTPPKNRFIAQYLLASHAPLHRIARRLADQRQAHTLQNRLRPLFALCLRHCIGLLRGQPLKLVA